MTGFRAFLADDAGTATVEDVPVALEVEIDDVRVTRPAS